MWRDPRLRGLSSEHHQALVLARSLAATTRAWTLEEGVRLAQRFEAELEPHFRVEEEVLLPALTAIDAMDLVERTEAEHAFLRAAVDAASKGDADAARAFGRRLGQHVRFEERELFPYCERALADAVLDEVGRRFAVEPAEVIALADEAEEPDP